MASFQLREHQNIRNQEETTPSPVHIVQEPTGQPRHQYSDIRIYGDSRVQLGDIIHYDNKEVESLITNVQARQLAASVRQWLRAPDATIDYNAACAKRHAGTGQWFVQSPVFTAWLRQNNSFLWLYGFAGCGKSVLCSTAIQHAFHHTRSQARSAVAFFFFTFNDDSKQDTSALLRALLLQLSGQVQSLDYDLTQLKETYDDGTPPVPILLECLRKAVNRWDHIYLLLDALDESPVETSRADMLSIINTIRGWQLPGLHLLVTSRDILDIREGLNADAYNMVALQNNNIDQDILRYVSYQMEHDRQLKRWGRHCETIKQHLAQRANGVFRWVECQLQPLRKCPNSKYDLDKCLKQLPRSLDETYERMLAQIDQNCWERAQRILTLLCLSSRPLSVPEVIDAIAVDIEETERYDPDWKLENTDDLLRICPGLIDITSHLLDPENTSFATNRGDESITQTKEVRIAHSSVQEYLSRRIIQGGASGIAISETNGHFQISKTCLIYLCNQDFLNQSLTKSLIKQYPFARFAAQYWHHHYRLVDTNSAKELEKRGLALLQTRVLLERWIRLYDVDGPWNKEICYDEEAKIYATPTYYASHLGLDGVLAHILTMSTADVNAQGGWYGNALQAASSSGYEKIVQILVNNGADVNAQGGWYGSALRAASEHGHEKVVQILVNNGADVNAQGGKYGNALQAASEHGHKKIVQILVDNGADVNAQGGYGNALQAASEHGHEKIVQILVDSGADVNAQGGYGYGNALQAASARGHEKLVQILVNNGADVNAQGGKYGNALQAASSSGHEKIVQILVDNGADVNAEGSHEYGSALQAASEHGHEKIVETLVDNGADVNAEGRKYGNALQAASANGHEKIVQILADNGADVNAQGGYDGNALQAASSSGYEKIVQALVDNRADINAQGGKYGNALQAASARGHEKVVQILVNNGADVNAQGGVYGNALQAASSSGHEKIVQILVDNGADVSVEEGREYANALQMASSNGHEKIVQILVDSGADVNAQGGYWYGNALQAASYNGHEKIVRTLVDNGADVNAEGRGLGNALRAASANGHEKIVQILVNNGADINAQGGYEYGNALQAASANGYEKIVQVLVNNGADVNAQGGKYGNALQVASSNGHEKIVQILVNNGADVNAQGGKYGNALQVASSNGHEKIVQILVDNGADVNAEGRGFGNALRAASANCHEKIVQILLKQGAKAV